MEGQETMNDACFDISDNLNCLNPEMVELEPHARRKGLDPRPTAGLTAIRILILDHHPMVGDIFRQTLIEAGHRVESTEDQDETGKVLEYAPGCIILNLFPICGKRPFNLIDETRSWFQGPIIVVSEACSESTRVMAFRRGADEYLCAPFGLREFTARMDALLRRSYHPSPPLDYLKVGRLLIDMAARSAFLNGQELQLTNKEFDILVCLAKKPGVVVSAETLLSQVWGASFIHYSQTLRVHISNLRRKARSVSALPDFIRSVPSNGYILALKESPPSLDNFAGPSGAL